MPNFSNYPNTNEIVNVILEKKKVIENDISFTKKQITLFDAAKQSYQRAVEVLDGGNLKDINTLNDSLLEIQSAYQDRIDAGARSTLFWNMVGINTGTVPATYTYTVVDAAKIITNSTGIGGTSITLTVDNGFGNIGFTTIFFNENGYVENLDDLSILGIGYTAKYGLKIYDEPYTKDVLSSLVASFPGSVGILDARYSVGFVTVSYGTSTVSAASTSYGIDFVSAGIKTGDIVRFGIGGTFGGSSVSGNVTPTSFTMNSTLDLTGDPIETQQYTIYQGMDLSTLNVLVPIDDVTGIETGQIITARNKTGVFYGETNTIVGIGTTIANLSTLGFSTTSEVYQLTLKNPAAIPAENREQVLLDDGGDLVIFDVTIDPDTVSNSLGFPAQKRPKFKNGKPEKQPISNQPFIPQRIARYTRIDTDNNFGVRIVYHRSTDDPTEKKWNHFMEGVPGWPNEPKVGSGIIYYSVGFTQEPSLFGQPAKEGDTIVSNSTLISFLYSSLSPNTALDNAIQDKIDENEALDAEFLSNYSTFESRLDVSNLLRDDANELNERIWGCRTKLGESLEILEKYNLRLDTFTNSEVLPITNPKP